MGSRANSTLFYGIHWNECESVFEDEYKEVDEYGFTEELQKKFPDLFFKGINCYEKSYCLCIPETLYSGDWDCVTVLDLDKLNLSKEERYAALFIEACKEFKMNYKEPKLQMQAHYW